MDFGPVVEAAKIILRARYAFAAWVTCGLAIAGHHFKVVSLPETAYLIVALFGVFSLLVWIVELVLAKWDDRKAKAADRAKEDEVLCFLDTLAKQELHILAKALARNAQALSLGKLGVPLAMAHKGLLEPITNSQGDYIIPSFVWRRLKEQEQNIIARAKAVNPNETYEAKKAIDEGY